MVKENPNLEAGEKMENKIIFGGQLEFEDAGIPPVAMLGIHIRELYSAGAMGEGIRMMEVEE